MAKICSVDDCGGKVVARGWCNKHYLRHQNHGTVTPYKRPSRLEWLKSHACHDGDACLDWPYGKSAHGRGVVEMNGVQTTSANAMCQLAHGHKPSDSHEAAHSCGNGHLGCVNPKHLRWATHAENMADCLIHGTHTKGSRNGSAKLTDEDVGKIRELFNNSVSGRTIASMYGVSYSTIHRVVYGRSWKNG